MKRVSAIVLGFTLATGFAGARSEEAPPAPVAMDATPECAALREQEFIQWEEGYRMYAEFEGATEVIAFMNAQVASGAGVRERVRALMGPVSSSPYSDAEPPRRCKAPDREGRVAEYRAMERLLCQYVTCDPASTTIVDVDACGAVWVKDTARPDAVSKFCD